MKFESHEEIVSKLLNDFAAELGVDYISSASDIAIKSKVYAAQIEGLYYNQQFIMKQSNPVTATGNYLDMWAKSLTIEPRKEETGSKGYIVLGRETPFSEDIKIPKGTIVSTNENIIGKLINVETLEDAILEKGLLEIRVKAKSIEKGIESNLPKNALSIINNPPVGIEFIKQPEPFTDGADRENDDDFRKRFEKERFNGTKDAFAKRAMEVPGVAAAKTLELNRGPGTADILISTEEGLPSDELLEKTLKHLLKKRPICSDIDVIRSKVFRIDFNIKVALKDDMSLDSVIDSISVKERIKQAIRVYLKAVGIDGIIRISGISSNIYLLDEVIDVEVISPNKNIELKDHSIGQEGEINVSVL